MDKKIKISISIAAVALFGMALSVFVYARYIEPGILVETHQEIAVPKEYSLLENLKVIFITDIHYDGTQRSEKLMEELVAKVCAHNPDIILLGGDYVCNNDANKRQSAELVGKALSRMHSKFGIYAVLGNHESGVMEDIKLSFLENGIKLLDNSSVRIASDNGLVNIVGLNYMRYNFKKAFDNISKTSPTICVTHIPELLERHSNSPAFLYLCGNTHGGQTAGFILNLLPNKLNTKFIKGLYNCNERILYVSSGIGLHSTIKYRFLCPPEFVVLTFKYNAQQ